MSLLSFSQVGPWFNAIVFAVAAAIVWTAGTRLTGYVDEIAETTGMNRAFMGMLFLGGVTSLPEVAAVSSSAWSGNAPLATNNLLGSVCINVMLIAIADAVIGRDALTSVVAGPATIMQGTLNILVLSLTATAILVGDVGILGVGIWPVLLAAACVASFYLAMQYSKRAPWHVDPAERKPAAGRPEASSSPRKARLSALTIKAIAAGAVIVVAGYLLSRTGEAIAKDTGLGSGLVGLVVVGFATSLPELSSITEAVRRRRYEMALGDVFGTNLLTIALILPVDAIFRDGPVLNEAGKFEAVAALLGCVLTGLFLIGLLERRNKTILRMGYDAIAALIVFPAGIVLLYFLQAQ